MAGPHINFHFHFVRLRIQQGVSITLARRYVNYCRKGINQGALFIIFVKRKGRERKASICLFGMWIWGWDSGVHMGMGMGDRDRMHDAWIF